MTYDELVSRVKEETKNARVSKTIGHVAFQFNVRGEGEGAFYLEIEDGRIFVEPYEYYDRDVLIETTADIPGISVFDDVAFVQKGNVVAEFFCFGHGVFFPFLL